MGSVSLQGGGAIAQVGVNSTIAELADTQFERNEAATSGGALALERGELRSVVRCGFRGNAAGEPEGGWPVPDAGCGQIYERSSSKPSRCSRRFFLDTKRLATIGIVAGKTLNTQRLWGLGQLQLYLL